MYNNSYLGTTGLAATGMAIQGLWWFMAGFALLAAAMAIGRVLPKGGR